MPKLKTNKGAVKRLRVTRSGKIKRFRAGKRHLLSGKRSHRKRFLRRSTHVKKGDMQVVLRHLGLKG